MRFLHPPKEAPCGLGLDGLPPGLDLPCGLPVALGLQDQAVDQRWLQALLEDMLQHGPVCMVAQHANAIDTLLLHPPLEQARQQGRLLLWLLDPDLAYASRPDGLGPFLEELRQGGLGPRHALLLLATPPAHLGHSVQALQAWAGQWARWCRKWPRPVVLAFCGWSQAQEVLAPLRTLAHTFSHVAMLGHEAGRPLLFVERWNSPAGPVFETRFGLQVEPGMGRLCSDGTRLQAAGLSGTPRLLQAPDQDTVLATRAALAGQTAVPVAWQVLDDLDAVQAAAQTAIAATVLLDAGPPEQQLDLLQRVYQLRSTRGRALKIVVRESSDKVRANLEQGLMQLGANTLVYRELGFARLQKRIEELREQTFVGEVAADFTTARAAFLPEPQCGYLAPTAFCDSVQAMLERSATLGLRHSLLRLRMQATVAHLDALQACSAARPGDVLTADENALYVFLFACASSDLEPALARLFSLAPGELFAAQTLYTSPDDMASVLQSLRAAAQEGLPDYRSYASLQRSQARAAGLAAAPANLAQAMTALPPRDEGTGPPQQASAATPRVQPSPLGRRNASAPQGAQPC